MRKFKRENKEISMGSIDSIIKKLNNADIIHYDLILHCPNCDETSYMLKDFSTPTVKKWCDTCTQYYDIIKGETLE